MNAMCTPATTLPIDQNRIPTLIKALPRWVTWRAGPTKPTGKFDKVPINPSTGRNVNGNDPANWMSFDSAYKAYTDGKCTGIGIALCDEPIGTFGNVLCGAPQYLVALDFDHCSDNLEPIKAINKDLGKTYGETSPSGNGIRMFALSRELTKGGNAGDGRELYSTGRFVTVTGMGGRGNVVDATEKLAELSCRWFPGKASQKVRIALEGGPPALRHANFPMSRVAQSLAGGELETPENVTRVQSQLALINADCDYELWRNVVWAVLSTGWVTAEAMARDWSATGGDRYDEKAYNTLVASFDPTRGITLRTLNHFATLAGWQPIKVALQLPQVMSAKVNSKGEVRQNRLLSATDLAAMPDLLWLIKNLLPAKGLASIYGQSGSGKTFFALAMACAVAAALDNFFGFKVKWAPVAYVALEGSAGLKHRVKALEMHNKSAAPPDIRFLFGGFTLLQSHHVDELAAEILQSLGTGAVVFVDTLNQSAPGLDENSSADMGIVLSNAKALAEAVDGLVILVHHSGKDQGKGMRGHSSLHAAMDAVIEVVNTSNGRAWRVSKSKDGESGTLHGFELVSYVVGQDTDGEDIRSCAVRPALTGTAKSSKVPTGRNQKTALNTLIAASIDRPNGVPLADALRQVAAKMPGPDGRSTSRAKEAIESLIKLENLDLSDGHLFVL